MNSKFIKEEIKYTGKELVPHWIYKQHNILGDAIVAFIGECEVKLDSMVDISDVISNSPIYSKKMLNFIVEHFNIPLTEGVLRQRMLIVIAREVIENYLTQGEKIIRKGDDLFWDDAKLSVSIATKSPTSVLIHFAMNIDSEGAPVKAAGLNSDMKLENIEEIAQNIMKAYCLELKQICDATCKVRGVF